MLKNFFGKGKKRLGTAARKENAEKRAAEKAAVKAKARAESAAVDIETFEGTPQLRSIEKMYLSVLESQYQNEKRIKKMKRFKILASIRTIQRSWRRFFLGYKIRAVVRI